MPVGWITSYIGGTTIASQCWNGVGQTVSIIIV
jgi:hypothetical protein